MRVTDFSVRNFRSVYSANIESCGPLTILVGKNNAGKSNILRALNLTLTTLAAGELWSNNSPLGESENFTRKSPVSPIDISVRLQLDAVDKRALLGILRGVENSSAFTPADHMRIAIRCERRLNFTYVASLNLEIAKDSLGPPLVTLSGEAARRLGQRERISKDVDVAVVLLKNFKSNEKSWKDAHETVRSAPEEAAPVVTEMVTGRRLDGQVSRPFYRLLQSRTDHADFSAHANSTIARLESLQKRSIPGIQSLGQDVDDLPEVAVNVLKLVGGVDFRYVEDKRDRIGEAEAGRLLRMKLKRGSSRRFNEIQETVHGLMGVRMDAFEPEGQLQRRKPHAELDLDDFLLRVNGAGYNEALQLVLQLELEEPELLIIEEPEVHLHPGLEVALLDYLKQKSNETQIFLSTHSTSFLDQAEDSSVYLIRSGPGGNATRLSFGTDDVDLLSELGLRLSSVFMYDRLVFVEGPTDEAVLRAWAKNLGMSFSDANLGFIHMGGSRNFTHYTSAETLSFLAKRNVQMWFLLDRDEQSSREINLLIRRCAPDLAKVVILERRELENYLALPEAIQEFISQKRAGAGNSEDTPSLDEITEALGTVADGLKQRTIERRALRELTPRLYPDRRKILDRDRSLSFNDRLAEEFTRLARDLQNAKRRMPRLVEKIRNEIDQIWDGEKFTLVPGDELIDGTCRKFNQRFHKEQDGARIASMMDRSTIDPYLREFIEEISSVQR